jgi:hypothetical protein
MAKGPVTEWQIVYVALVLFSAAGVTYVVVRWVFKIRCDLYPTDTAGLCLGAAVAGFLLYLGFAFEHVRLDVAAAAAAVVIGYVVEATHRLDDKDGLRKAVVADIASIMNILDETNVVFLVESLVKVNASDRLGPARGTPPETKDPAKEICKLDIDPYFPKKTPAPDFLRDMSSFFEPSRGSETSPTSQGAEKSPDSTAPSTDRRSALRYTLEQLTEFRSTENYFSLWDQVVKSIGDLPDGAVDPVTRFYTNLHGSRDVLRGAASLRIHAYDAGPDGLKEDMKYLEATETRVIYAAICFGNEALRQLDAPDVVTKRYWPLEKAARDAAREANPK